LPLLHQIDSSKDEVQGLILSPTRELAQQIKKQLFKFTKYTESKIFVEAVYGGEKIDRQIKNLKRTTHIIVATPGRLIDLIDKNAVNIKHINTLILDEADEMLSMGFKQELNRILKTTTGKRHTWLFSATMPEAIQSIIKTYMSQNAVRTKAGTQSLCKALGHEGFSVGALEGDMQQKERDKVMRAFKKENLQILVSTDVSARGIDVNDLTFVIHHQLPEHLEYYTHRSGRTARAGKTGSSIALVLPNELQRIKEIEKALGIKFKETMI